MNDPVDNNGEPYGVISDIDPDGGAAYTTLQAWYEDTYDEAVVQHARCHHGEAAGLGTLIIPSTPPPTWASHADYDADHPCCIYAADGDEQDGSQDDELQGAAVVVTAFYAAGIISGLQFMRLAALRVAVKSSAQNGLMLLFSGSPGACVVERCMIVMSSVMPTGITLQALTAGHAAIVRNNLIINTTADTQMDGICVMTVGMSSQMSAGIFNTSIFNCASGLGGGISAVHLSTGQIDIAARNNVVVHDGSQAGYCFAATPGGGTVNWTGSSHNVSSDDTADSVAGGSDNIISAATGDVWADPPGRTPFAPLREPEGVLDPPNGVNLFSEGADGVTTDALGKWRPESGPFYRGGVELRKVARMGGRGLSMGLPASW